MELTILNVLDETPKGLTSGFRLKLTCQTPGGEPFVLDMPILMSKEVLAKQIPLPNLALRYLEREGLEAWPDVFVDTRRLHAEELSATPLSFPHSVTLGGAELLNQKALESIAKRKTGA